MAMKSFIKTPAVLLAFICIPFLSEAQPGNGGPDPDPPPVGVPLDGGLGVLVAAGLAYSAKRKYDKRKTEKVVDNSQN